MSGEPLVRPRSKVFSSESPLAVLRSEPDEGVEMRRIFNDPRGRPGEFESRRRTRAFVEELARTGSPRAAQTASRVAPARALELLDDPAVWAVLVAAKAAAA